MEWGRHPRVSLSFPEKTSRIWTMCRNLFPRSIHCASFIATVESWAKDPITNAIAINSLFNAVSFLNQGTRLAESTNFFHPNTNHSVFVEMGNPAASAAAATPRNCNWNHQWSSESSNGQFFFDFFWLLFFYFCSFAASSPVAKCDAGCSGDRSKMPRKLGRSKTFAGCASNALQSNS